MYFADFETTTDKYSKNYSEVWLWGVKGAMHGDKLHYGIDMASFFDTLIEEKMTTVYFHNLSFDGNYIYKWLIKQKFKFINMMDEKYGKYKLQDGEWEWICDERGNIYTLMVNYKGTTIKFLDSWKVLMASVEKLGESIGLEKLDLDYDAYGGFKTKEEVPPEAIEYLERDIDVVINTITKAFGIYNKKMTRASMAYEDFIAYYNDQSELGRQFAIDFGGWVWDYRAKEKVWNNVLTKEQWRFVNKSYQGGYTYWNQTITNKEVDVKNGVSYDVNSLYPAVMMNYQMVYGKMLYTKPMSGDYVALKTILIQSATIKDKSHPPLIRKHGGKYSEAKYLQSVKYTEYTWWEEEFEFIKKYYDIDYIEIKTVYFRTKWVFREWLEEKKELKTNAKDPVERDFHKGIYNSCYGKFAQNIKMGSRVIVEDGRHVEEIDGVRHLVNSESGEVIRKLASNAIRYGDRGQYMHEPFFKEVDQIKHVGVASYITMKARMILFKAMMDNVDIWLYSDTDSCYYSEEPKNIEIHESKFGAWKAEHKFDKFKVLRAKCYMLHSTAYWKNGKWHDDDDIVKKISGLSKKGKDKVNFDNFFLGSIIKEGKRGSKNVDGGKLIINTDFKLGKEEEDD